MTVLVTVLVTVFCLTVEAIIGFTDLVSKVTSAQLNRDIKTHYVFRVY